MTSLVVAFATLLLAGSGAAAAVAAGNAAAAEDRQCQCGIRNGPSTGRIINGDDADPNEWPWMVFITNTKLTGGDGEGGGSLISEKYVLTAAHVVKYTPADPAALKLFLEAHQHPFDTPFALFHRAQRVVQHYHWDEVNLNYDYALVELPQPVMFSDTLRPVCLPGNRQMWDGGYTGTAIGWGVTEIGFSSQVLQEFETVISSISNCENFIEGYLYHSTEDKLCTYNRHRKGVCDGDSGGPVMVLGEDDRWRIAGVSSYTLRPCGSSGEPDVWARVSSVLGWIRHETANSPPCEVQPLSIVDGNWGSWGTWSSCSVSCGSGGIRTRRRQCDDPAPSGGGAACVGDDTQTESCGGHLTCPDDCYDRLEAEYGLGYYCRLYERYGYCDAFRDTLEYWCADTCGFCGCTNYLAELVGNGDYYCDLYAQYRYCTFSSVRYYCADSCDACDEYPGGNANYRSDLKAKAASGGALELPEGLPPLPEGAGGNRAGGDQNPELPEGLPPLPEGADGNRAGAGQNPELPEGLPPLPEGADGNRAGAGQKSELPEGLPPLPEGAE